MAIPVDTVVQHTVTRTGAQVEAQFDDLVSRTSLADLAAQGKTEVKTVKESQLRELIRQAISQVLISRSGQGMADEALIRQVQDELKRSLAATRRQESERDTLLGRIAQLERERDVLRARHDTVDDELHRVESHAAQVERQLENARAAKDALEKAYAALNTAHATLRQEAADLSSLMADESTTPSLPLLLAATEELDTRMFQGRHRRRLGTTATSEQMDRAATATVHAMVDRLDGQDQTLSHLCSLLGSQGLDPVPALERLLEARAKDQRWINELQQKLSTIPAPVTVESATDHRACADEAARLTTGLAQAQARIRDIEDECTHLRDRLAASQVPEAAGRSFAASGGRERIVAALDGSAVRWRESDAGWVRENLALPCRPGVAGRVHPGDGRDRLFAIRSDGAVLEDDGRSQRDLTHLTQAPHAAGHGPSLALAGAAAMLAYRGQDDRLHLLQGDRLWLHVPVQKAAGLDHLPAHIDPACWWWAREGTRHITLVDNDGRILELFDLGGRWQYADLSAQSGAPAAAGGVAGYAPAGVEHVLFTGRDGHLHHLAYDGSSAGWTHQPIGSLVGLPPVLGIPAGAYRDGRHLVATRSAAGDLLLLEQVDGDWTSLTHQAPRPAGDPVFGPGTEVRYPGADGRMILLDGANHWTTLVLA